MKEYYKDIKDSALFLNNNFGIAPKIALVLGSGYAKIAEGLDDAKKIPYQKIPNFPLCTNPNHSGQLLVGCIKNIPVAVLQGRIHAYEGHNMDKVVFAVRSLAMWGCSTFILTNAAGAINSDFKVGEFMAINDHINFIGQNPLVGRADFGQRFPDMTTLYDKNLISSAIETAKNSGFRCHQGVYAAMLGPSYETPAEIKMLRVLNSDAVGMSTVPEAIAVKQMGCRVFGLSCLTNLAAGISKEEISDDEIVQVFDKIDVQKNLKLLIEGVLNAAAT